MNHTSCQFRDKHTVGGIVFYKHAFLVISLYLLNMLIDQVDTLHWSEVLCCTIMSHLSDLEVKVMGHRF